MAKMIKVTVIWNGTEEETWLNTDRILSIKPDRPIKDDTGLKWLEPEKKRVTCTVDFEGYNESLMVKESAKDLANRINYE